MWGIVYHNGLPNACFVTREQLACGVEWVPFACEPALSNAGVANPACMSPWVTTRLRTWPDGLRSRVQLRRQRVSAGAILHKLDLCLGEF